MRTLKFKRAVAMKKLVLTGGPCSGKSTAISFLREKLSEQGFEVICVPEVATIVIGAGVSPAHLSLEDILIFQEKILKTQIHLENMFADFLKMRGNDDEKRVLICDRGCMDVKAYVSSKQLRIIFKNNDWDKTSLRDQRYDAVFHLITAAEGKEEFYTLENNAARSETPEQARKLDLKIRKAWLGHPHLRVVDNSTDFDGKLKRLLRSVQQSLGIPVSLEIERKFLLAPWFLQKNIPVPYQEIIIEQCYLEKRGDGMTRRIRKRWQKHSDSVFYLTEKRSTGNARVRVETEKHITAKQYQALKQEADQTRDIIGKQRLCFLWKNQYFELDVFLEPEKLRGLSVLEIELTEENDKVELPDFLKIQREITEDESFSNSSLARKDYDFKSA
ncbi:MAG: AAA family ATPase [Candidatus Harrisonbacteria bacterium]|nr:AAA family ATPase [Candidatus Harrisonbacteria bacterium]